MPKKRVSFDINLVPKDPFFKTPMGRVLKWALSIGRYIVIFTELLVIISFVTRFTLDRQVTDLNDSINQKKIIISSYGALEQDFRKAQSILEEYQQIRQQINLTEIFPELTKVLPKAALLEELVIRSDQVVLSGIAPDQTTLNTMINNLQLSDKFLAVSIDKIEASSKSKQPGFEFTIKASTREEEKQKTDKKTNSKTNVLDRTGGL